MLPNRFRSWLKVIGITAVVAVIFCVGIEVVVRSLPLWSLIYCAETSFEELPADDLALINAIKAMDERVREDRVEVERSNVDGAIRVTFAMSGDLWNRPGIEKLDQLCAELGYKRPRGRFTPSEVTDSSWLARHEQRDPRNQMGSSTDSK